MGAAAIISWCLLGAPQAGAATPVAPLSRGWNWRLVVPEPARQAKEEVPIDGDLAELFQKLLLRAGEDDELAKLFAQIRGAKNLPFDPTLLRQLQSRSHNPLVRKSLLDLARQVQNGRLSPADLESLQRMLSDLTNASAGPAGPAGPAGEVAAPSIEERFTDWLKDILTDLDEGGLGEFLRDSPAWRDALRGLEQSMAPSAPKFDWLAGGAARWNLLELWKPKVDAWGIKAPTLPELPAWRLRPPNLGRFQFNLARFGGPPSFAAPAVGDFKVSDSLLWFVALVLLAVGAWWFCRKFGPAAAGQLLHRRGPWPVQPAEVTTRAQLIQAFDYLALSLLGDSARPWNHLTIARRLATDASRVPSVQVLARWYELARYAPGEDPLPPEIQAEVRRELQVLAGSGA